MGRPPRFSEPALLVLISLLDGPRHGYAIADDIERLTGDRPGPGSLYGAVSRLVGTGLIAEGDADGRRRPYRLTPRGMSLVRAEVATMAAVSHEARRRLRAAPQAGPA
ncbi:MAG: helix-turn-helix transcriptional regulator [Nocardioidaceae bacterium]|nr:helix-turn-helix transcriptional regulator [Nocardioidaceae bacterium]